MFERGSVMIDALCVVAMYHYYGMTGACWFTGICFVLACLAGKPSIC